MSDQNLPKPTEISDPVPAPQPAGQRQSGGQPTQQEADPMQSNAAPDSAAASVPAATGPNPSETPQRIPFWLQQAERFLRVIVRMYLGLLVCCAPWYPAAWDNNPLFTSSPWLLAFVTQGAVRGVVSGLGVLNLWIAVRDALRSSPDRDSQ